MNLIKKVEELKELRKMAADSSLGEDIYRDCLSINSPAILEVLSCFQEGDANRIDWIRKNLICSRSKDENCARCIAKDECATLDRLQQAAKLMEESA